MSWIWHTTCREVELGIASDCRVLKNFKTERTNDSDKLIIYKPSRSQLSLILEILAITLAKLGLVAALRLSPVGRGQELDGWPTANIVVEVHTLFFFFFFFFYANRMVLFLKVYWKAFFRAPHLEKKNLKHKYVSASHDFIILRSVVQSWNFAHFDLYLGGEARSKLINLGFPQCKTNSSGDFRGKRQGFDGN